jgi:hypothetical protein
MKYRNTKKQGIPWRHKTCLNEPISFDYIDEGKHLLILPKTDQQQPNMKI